MSRHSYSPDPQDTRIATPQQSGEQPRSAAKDDRAEVPEIREQSDRADTRSAQPRTDERSDSLRAYSVRDRTYLLRDPEVETLAEIGKFRVIAGPDLATYAYHGDRARMENEIGRLERHGLVRDKTVEIPHKKTLRVVTLTKNGHRLLTNASRVRDGQAIYHELRKPREVAHDADLYRLYQKEAARIERAGGRPLRVILDYELKKNLNRDLALLGRDKEGPGSKNEIAEKHGLQVVNGRIQLPDLRIEYETAEQEVRHLDLELATREYRPQAISAKAAAGFSFYSRPEDAARLRRILNEREITAAILTL